MEDSSAATHLAAAFPNKRMGAALVEYRQRCGMSRRAVANESDIDSHRLKSYEQGRIRIPDRDLVTLAALYEVEVAELLPPRAPLDFDPQRSTLRVSGVVRKVQDPGAGSYAVLKEYLRIVYELRDTSRLERIPLREADLDALAEALGRKPKVIEQRLIELMDCSHSDAIAMRRVILRRRLVMPAAGLVIGAGVLGGLKLGNEADTSGGSKTEASVTNASSASADYEPVDDVDEVEIGTAIVIEQGDDEPTVRD